MSSQNFNKQLVEYKDQLFNFAISLTCNPEDAKDLLQETLFRAYKYRYQFENDTNQKAWTYRIMKNTFINNYKKSKKQKNNLGNKNSEFVFNLNRNSNQNTPECNVYVKEIWNAINKLNYKFKEPFLMYLNGFRYKEIADKYNLSLGTVKSRIFLTRKKLMNELKEFTD